MLKKPITSVCYRSQWRLLLRKPQVTSIMVSNRLIALIKEALSMLAQLRPCLKLSWHRAMRELNGALNCASASLSDG